MLTSVEVYNAIGVLALTLHMDCVTNNSPYQINSITGDGPVGASISSTPYATQDGEGYDSSRVGPRNLVFNLGLRLGFETVRKLRNRLYGVVPPKAKVTLRFIDDEEPDVEIDGYVETHEPSIFTKDPGVVFSVLCLLAPFKALKPTVISTYANKIIDLNYEGSADTGFLLELYIDRDLSLVTLKNGVDPNLVYNGQLLEGDKLLISTVPGSKYIKRTRDGNTYSVLDWLVGGSLSMQIGPLTTGLQVVAGAANLAAKVTYTTKYVGI